MSIYERALRHARFMAGALIVAILFVLVIDRYFGHANLAFALVVFGLVLANARMLRFNCPDCGKNLFFHGIFVLPWPNKTCSKCGKKLEEPAKDG